MDTIICDITAFDYWRIPPVVQLLLVGDESSPTLVKSFKEEDVVTTREAMADCTLCTTALRPSSHSRNLGASAKAIMPAIPILAANHNKPVDILVDKRSKCHSSNIVRPRFIGGNLPIGATEPIDEYISVTSPAFTLLQLARRANLARTIMLICEACGAFAVFKAPPPVRTALQNAARNRTIPKIGGWEPLFNEHGLLTDLWSRPALTTPQELLRIVNETEFARGRARLQLAATLAEPGAASPFEARAGILLGLSRRRGGEGFSGFSFNRQVDLKGSARMLAGRNYCVCDLYWESGLDVECQSALIHNNAANFLSDSNRTAALKHMGIDVLPITYDQLKNERKLQALAKTIASLRGQTYRPKTPAQEVATRNLRTEVFTNWSDIHLV